MDKILSEAEFKIQRGIEHYRNFIENFAVKHDKKKAETILNITLQCFRNSIDVSQKSLYFE